MELSALLNKMFVFVALMLIGYFLARRGVIGQSFVSVGSRLAVDVFVNGIVHYIGAFYVDLQGLDYLVFTAGIGENSALIRRMVCEKLSVLGVKLDEAANEAVKGRAAAGRSGEYTASAVQGRNSPASRPARIHSP